MPTIIEYNARNWQSLAHQGFVVEQITQPGSPSTARIIYNSTTGRYEYWNGTIWQPMDGSNPPAGSVPNTALATNPLARANHTGTQTASTISDLATVVQGYRLDQFAAPTSALSINSQRLTSVADPTSAQDSATKNYVDNQISLAVNGHDWKDSVKAATTANITLSGTQTVDGVALVAGDRVLVKNQTTGANNGIYLVAAGAWTRTTDADNSPSGEVTSGMTVPVEGGGTTNGGTVWLLTTANPITLGTTSLSFTQVGAAGATYTAGTGLQLVGNVFSLVTPVTVGNGGTNATTASGARSSLAVPRSGAVLAVPALTAGVEATIAHGSGTGDAVAQVRAVSDGSVVGIKIRTKDATNVYVTSDVAVSSGVLELVYSPVVS